MARPLPAPLAIVVGSLLGALTTGWVQQHRFWKRPRATKNTTNNCRQNRLLLCRFSVQLELRAFLRQTLIERKKPPCGRESTKQLSRPLSTQLAVVFSSRAIGDYRSLDAALRMLSEMPAEAAHVKVHPVGFRIEPLDLDLAPDFDEIRHRKIKQVGRPDRVPE